MSPRIYVVYHVVVISLLMSFAFEKTIYISLICMLVPGFYEEQEYGLFHESNSLSTQESILIYVPVKQKETLNKIG